MTTDEHLDGLLCPYCRHLVDRSSEAGNLRRIMGWEQLRTDGGGHAIVGRLETGQWAHTACFRDTQHPPQEALFHEGD